MSTAKRNVSNVEYSCIIERKVKLLAGLLKLEEGAYDSKSNVYM